MIREYRIVTDGERFRVQSRRRVGIGWCLWGRWEWAGCSTFSRLGEAEQSMDYWRREDRMAREDHGWQPVRDARDPDTPATSS
jgi:hypothetical protein